ncbi:MAG TPA: hypothetical protein VII66_03995 [Gemmatimonadaceae bacterium]
MVEISIIDGNAVFDVQGLDKVWSLKSQIQVPLSHITSAVIDQEAARGWWHGLRMPGTQIPGVITAGTFYQHGRRVFYDVHDTDNTIVIGLNHESYDHLVVEVMNPQAEVTKIMSAITPRRN